MSGQNYTRQNSTSCYVNNLRPIVSEVSDRSLGMQRWNNTIGHDMGIIILFLDSHVAMFQYWNILTAAFEKETEQQFYKLSLT